MKEVKRQSEVAVLSDREIEIFQLLADGGTRKSIASYYNLSPRTIESSVYKVFEKTNCKTQESVLALLFRNGLIS